MSAGALGLALLAGLFSILSPCVLPLLPIVLGSAAGEHGFGPLALAAGLTLAFTAIGLFVALVGVAIGLDSALFRQLAAILMIGVGFVLAAPALQIRIAAAGGPMSDWIERRWGGFTPRGLAGQFSLGLLLGAVWSPCAGPTLGAASLLAAEGKSLPFAAAVMAMFGLGAGIPLVLLGQLSRKALAQWRDKLIVGGKRAKAAFGLTLAAFGLSIATGLDQSLEATLLDLSPAWLSGLSARF